MIWSIYEQYWVPFEVVSSDLSRTPRLEGLWTGLCRFLRRKVCRVFVSLSLSLSVLCVCVRVPVCWQSSMLRIQMAPCLHQLNPRENILGILLASTHVNALKPNCYYELLYDNRSRSPESNDKTPLKEQVSRPPVHPRSDARKCFEDQKELAANPGPGNQNPQNPQC